MILSSDAVAAALLGALVETLGYLVRFYHPPESVDDAMRRERPAVALVDCEDPTLMHHELLGRARMRGVSVIVFATSNAIERVRELAAQHSIQALLMPASVEDLDAVLARAVQKSA